MILILILTLVLVPLVLGTAALKLLDGHKAMTAMGDRYTAGFCMVIGVTQAVYLAAVVLNLTVSRMALFMGLFILFAVFFAILFMILRRRNEKKKEVVLSRFGLQNKEKFTGIQWFLISLLILSILFQLIQITAGNVVYGEGDMTLETVNTFLNSQVLYQTNPLTGQPYTAGVPMRLKILCLPGFYTFLCEVMQLDVRLVVARVVPSIILLASYAVYDSLGRTLFGKDRTGRLLFILAVSVLYMLGDYMLPMDGFLMLHCGYRGTAIRNGILLPFVWNMCLNRRWKPVLLAILAEACIVWTLYGFGYCLASALLILLIHVVTDHNRKREGRTCRSL